MDSSLRRIETQPIVYCGNLSVKTSVAELVALFSEVAPIVHIKLVKKDGNAISSSAFVTFHSLKDAEKIIENFNYHSIHNKQMILSICDSCKSIKEEANLFVKNLPKHIGSKDLDKIFSVCGKIISSKVSVDENGESKGFGFVQFESPESAENAIKQLNETKIGENTILVSKYDKSYRGSKSTENLDKITPTGFNEVYMKNFPSTMTEEKLRSILEKFGKTASIYFPLNENTSLPLGYACAQFENPESAANAVEELHEKLTFPIEDYSDDVICPAPFYIQKLEKKKERTEKIRKQLENMSLKGSTSRNNLYVSNIPDTYSKEEMLELFGAFGQISSLRLQKQTPDTNKMFGYISFISAEAAAAAHDKLDGTLIDNNKIQISYYRPKIERSDVQKSSFLQKDSSKSQGTTKLVQSLVNTVEKTASLYKEEWVVLNATNSKEFSQKMAREFFNMTENELKDLISSSEMLEKKIKTVLKNKKENNTNN